MKRRALALLWLAILCIPGPLWAARMTVLALDSDVYLINKALKGLHLPGDIQVEVFSREDLLTVPAARELVAGSRVIFVDVMMSEPADYLTENIPLADKRVYALRGSRDDDGLKKKGFIFDPEVREYFAHLSVKNLQNLICRIASKELDPSISYGEVVKLPALGIYHPDAETRYERCDAYIEWYRNRESYKESNPWIGIMLFSSSLIEGQSEQINKVIRSLENDGWNVLAGFGKDLDVLKTIFLDEKHQARVELVLAFSLRFHSAFNDEMRSTLKELDVPVINAVNLYSKTIPEWREDPVGILPMEVVWTMANPEVSGLIEPTVLTGKVKVRDPETGRALFVHQPIEENIELLLPRLKKWLHLRKCANSEKKVAILYYNHSQGKQNIGASYLNVFASLEAILERMRGEGYRFESRGDMDRAMIQDLVLKYGRNIGNWAPGELEEMLRAQKVARLPIKTYKEWFEKLPPEFQKGVTQQWGNVEDSNIMARNGELIIPAIVLGNVLIMPEPARGWSDDPMKLYHSPVLYPHHQYVAAYLWLKHGFGADAMIHLGTHATHEWLPGKQAGLSASCPPEVLITDIPNIYPYIVDDVGEGIQAKRRGRAAIIDHLTPALKEGGLYHEYSRLSDMVNSYTLARSQDSQTTSLQMEQIRKLVRELGIDRDLGVSADSIEEERLVDTLEPYLRQLKESFMPYGLHTFGESPQGDALSDTVRCILKRNDKAREDKIRKALEDSGPLELDRLVQALAGRYIPSGEGNDPVRNTEAIPTGKNFYGFDPARIPSPAAFELGRKAAQEIIDKSLREKNRYPEKVAVVLWAVETMRNEGVNESTILYLMGIRPIWDTSGRTTGMEAIPGSVLNRPRIDVLINPSGLYRDLFPQFMLFLDKAVRLAAVQKDVENLISRHSAVIKARLLQEGMDEERAEKMSGMRVFSETPGSYGTGVSEMAGASGVWQSDNEIVGVYENRVGYAFGEELWGAEAKGLLRENLRGVDVAVHSISSNILGTMDNDDMFQYLGGLSLAVEKESGRAPDTLISMQRIPNQVEVESIAKTIGSELRTRYLNPKWIEGMKREGYAGAREMSEFLQNMWGWQVTAASAVDEAKWQQTYEVYVEDKYGMDLKAFFNKANPWAYQSMTARMLESVRKEYWKTDEKTVQKLSVEYAMNVVEQGVACCDHTCNNPLLNQMVVNIVSIPGLMAPEMVQQFKMAVEKAAGKALAEQVAARRELQAKLSEGSDHTKTDGREQKPSSDGQNLSEQASEASKKSEAVQGYKMEEVKTQDDTSGLSSSGAQWAASLFILLIIGLFAYGARRRT